MNSGKTTGAMVQSGGTGCHVPTAAPSDSQELVDETSIQMHVGRHRKGCAKG
jgi:hypothetical protein